MLADGTYLGDIKLNFENISNKNEEKIREATISVQLLSDLNKSVARVLNFVQFTYSKSELPYNFRDSKIKLTKYLRNYRECVLNKTFQDGILAQCAFTSC